MKILYKTPPRNKNPLVSSAAGRREKIPIRAVLSRSRPDIRKMLRSVVRPRGDPQSGEASAGFIILPVLTGWLAMPGQPPDIRREHPPNGRKHRPDPGRYRGHPINGRGHPPNLYRYLAELPSGGRGHPPDPGGSTEVLLIGRRHPLIRGWPEMEVRC